MKLHFLGATRQVTGSRYCLEWGDRKVLIDCGMFQERDFQHRNWDPFPIPPEDIDALILTHAHIDHCGLIPRLVKHGFGGTLFMTRPTVDLVEIMWRDAARIQAEDAEYKKKRHQKEGRIGPHPYEPLYTDRDVDRACGLVHGLAKHDPTTIVPGLDVTMFDAGHILGSASLQVDLHESGKAPIRIVFSGDVGQIGKPLVRDPEQHERADYLVLESTYGNRLHEDAGEVSTQLSDIINQTVDRGGKIIVPTFAVERAQQLMYLLAKLVYRHQIPRIPIFLDSPMAVDVTGIYLRHADFLDDETLHLLSTGQPPLRFPGLQMCRSVEESKAINDVAGPAMILSTAGMCNAGRIKHHLRNYIGDPKSTVLFVGYQGEGTLGRLILEGRKSVRIHGREYRVRAEIKQIFGFSGHADRNGLLTWIGSLEAPPRQTFLVHGEEASALALAQEIGQRGWDVVVPHYQDVAEVS